MIDFSLLHFIRPWAWSILPILLIIGWWFLHSKTKTVEWKNYLDEHLASWLLDSAKHQNRHTLFWPIVFILAAILVSFSAAGPAWEKQPVPISVSTTKAIIVLDLSPSMTVEDVTPSRIDRARFKILEILKKWQQGYIGLVAFADDGFVISPLTDDADTIANMVKILTPAIMPGQGSAADSGVANALNLLKQSDSNQLEGDILLITDGVTEHRLQKIKDLIESTNVRLSVLSIGTKQGAPIQSHQSVGFVTDDNGAIVIAKLNTARLLKLTNLSNGIFIQSQASNDDILSWLEMMHSSFDDQFSQIKNKKVDKWIDQGAIFLFPILLLMAFIFRKGLLFSFVLLSFYLPNPNLQAAEANTVVKPSSDKSELNKDTNSKSKLEDSLWNSLWYNNGQLGDKKMQANHPELALHNYTQPRKIAEALYRSGQYKKAAEKYQTLQGAEARYNQANALAQNKQLEEAIQQYQQAIKLNPNFEAAKKNLETVKKLLKQKKKQQKQQHKNDKNKNKDNNNKDKNDKNDKNKSDQKQQNNKDSNDSDDPSKSDQSDNSEQQKPPQQKNEPQQDKSKEQHKQQQPEKNKKHSDKKPQPMTAEQKQAEKQKQQMIEQWLRQIKDDPSRLLRNKLILEQRKRELTGEKPQQDEKEW